MTKASAARRVAKEAIPDSRDAWLRLLASLVLMTIGGSGMYAVVVVLPSVQAEFGVARADASLPYTMTMIGFGLGGIVMGRLADRFGVMIPVIVGSICLALGFTLAASASGLWQFALAQGLLIGLMGSSATFAPLVADASLWFDRRRGIAVAICASGNYLGGAIWPPIVQHFVETVGWRQAYAGVGIFCVLTMLPLAFALRRRPPALGGPEPTTAARADSASGPSAARTEPAGPAPQAARIAAAPPARLARDWTRPLGLSPGGLQTLLCIAGVSCCVAMSMPQVHIVAYCGDLGYGAARGAQMLSLMLGFGIVSRLVSGMITDRIGGLRTLLLGSALQTLALALFLPFDSLSSLYLISALFGLFQGGIVPSYAIIVREHFSPREAGTRVGTVLTATLLGMALGGWLSGKIFDLTGSYDAAFVNGIAWNLVNLAIVVFLIYRSRPRQPAGAVLAA
jgi:MFS family permease